MDFKPEHPLSANPYEAIREDPEYDQLGERLIDIERRLANPDISDSERTQLHDEHRGLRDYLRDGIERAYLDRYGPYRDAE